MQFSLLPIINKYNGLGLHTTRLLCYTRISPLHVHEDCWYYRWFPRLPHLRPSGLLLTEPSIAPRTPIAVFESDNLSTTTCSYIRPVSYITSLLCVRLYQSIPCLDPVRSSCLSTSCLLALHWVINYPLFKVLYNHYSRCYIWCQVVCLLILKPKQ